MDEVKELISPHWPRREGQDKVDIRDAWPIIECGDGWSDVLWHGHHIAKDAVPDYTVNQIKEKFGILRFYSDIPIVTEMMIESLSNIVCETCGELGTLSMTDSPHPWYRTLCAEHRGGRYLASYKWKEKYDR